MNREEGPEQCHFTEVKGGANLGRERAHSFTYHKGVKLVVDREEPQGSTGSLRVNRFRTVVERKPAKVD